MVGVPTVLPQALPGGKSSLFMDKAARMGDLLLVQDLHTGTGTGTKGAAIFLVTDKVKKKKQGQWINFIKNTHIHAECGDLLTPAQGQIIPGSVSSSWAGPDWATHLKKT